MGTKTALWDRLLTAMEHDIKLSTIGKKLGNLQGLSYMPKNLVNTATLAA